MCKGKANINIDYILFFINVYTSKFVFTLEVDENVKMFNRQTC